MSFFDSMDRTELKKMLEVRVADGSLLRLIGKCLHVGVLDGEALVEPELGTAPGVGEYTSYKVANMLVEFSTSIPRTQLRPGYGDGFLGAPLQTGSLRESPTPREQGGRRGTSSTHRAAQPWRCASRLSRAV